MTLSPETEQLLQWLIILSGVLLIPIGVSLLVVMFKLAFLIHSTSEFLAFASYELAPAVKDLRRMVGQLENIGEKASNSVLEIGNSLQRTRPVLAQGLHSLKTGASAFFSGLGRAFRR